MAELLDRKLSEFTTTLSAQIDDKLNPIVQQLNRVQTEVGAVSDAQADLAARQQDLEHQVEVLTKSLRTLRDERDADVNRAMRKNLLLYGVPETGRHETWAQSEQAARNTFVEALGPEAGRVSIERAHRVSGHPARPQPIVIGFSFYKEKEMVLAGRKEFKDLGYDVTNQYTAKARTAMKVLIPFVERARKEGKVARMAFNKAIVDNVTYVYDEEADQIEEQTRRPRASGHRKSDPPISQSPRGPSPSQRTSASRMSQSSQLFPQLPSPTGSPTRGANGCGGGPAAGVAQKRKPSGSPDGAAAYRSPFRRTAAGEHGGAARTRGGGGGGGGQGRGGGGGGRGNGGGGGGRGNGGGNSNGFRPIASYFTPTREDSRRSAENSGIPQAAGGGEGGRD